MNLPKPGAFVTIRSTKGDTVYWDAEVLGEGDSPRGRALWCLVPGPDLLNPLRVEAYIPIDEIQSWMYRG